MTTSEKAYQKIHEALGQWINGSLDCGFENDPLAMHGGTRYVDNLLSLADRMRRIEEHTDIPKETDQ